MEVTETLLNFDVLAHNDGFASAVIVAAGRSTRMGGVSKQMLTVGGIPVIARTLLAFERSKSIKDIVVVTRESDILAFQMIAQKYMISKLTDIIVGGDNREESVKNGINRLSDSTEYVLVHDGARPLISVELIDKVAENCKEHGAVACAVAVKDTIKEVRDGLIVKTDDRSNLYAMQTPQAFPFRQYKDCINSVDDLSEFTDDCAVAESCGVSIRIIDGDYNNIKITTKEDVAIAEGILSCKGEEV